MVGERLRALRRALTRERMGMRVKRWAKFLLNP